MAARLPELSFPTVRRQRSPSLETFSEDTGKGEKAGYSLAAGLPAAKSQYQERQVRSGISLVPPPLYQNGEPSLGDEGAQ